MYQALKILREAPETENAGQRWTDEEDKKLMELINDNIITAKVVDYHKIATEFKRTIGSIKARIKLNIYNMIDDDNNIEDLCNKYLVDINEMTSFVENKNKAVEKKLEKTKKVSIDDVYNLLVSYKDDIDEIKTSIKFINKKLKKLEIYDDKTN
jgi:hypothetical protein